MRELGEKIGEWRTRNALRKAQQTICRGFYVSGGLKGHVSDLSAARRSRLEIEGRIKRVLQQRKEKLLGWSINFSGAPTLLLEAGGPVEDFSQYSSLRGRAVSMLTAVLERTLSYYSRSIFSYQERRQLGKLNPQPS